MIKPTDAVTCTTKPPATGRLEVVFQSSGAAGADTTGCCILAPFIGRNVAAVAGCNVAAAVGKDDCDITTDDREEDVTLTTGCASNDTCDVDGVTSHDDRCNQQIHLLFLLPPSRKYIG